MDVTDPHLWVNRSEFFFRCEHQNRSEKLSPPPWIIPRSTRMKTDPRTNSILAVDNWTNVPRIAKVERPTPARDASRRLHLKLQLHHSPIVSGLRCDKNHNLR